MSAWQKLVLSVLLLAAVWTAYGAAQRAVGAANERAARLELERDAALALADSLNRHRVVQTETLRVVRVRRDTVLLTHDRWLRDTVPVPVDVVREIVRADSAVIQACTATLLTCEQETSALRAALLRSDSLVTVWQHLARPSLWKQITDRVPYVAAGYLFGRFTP